MECIEHIWTHPPEAQRHLGKITAFSDFIHLLCIIISHFINVKLQKILVKGSKILMSSLPQQLA